MQHWGVGLPSPPPQMPVRGNSSGSGEPVGQASWATEAGWRQLGWMEERPS